MQNLRVRSTVEGLFHRWPQLLGFSIQDTGSLTSDREWVRLDEGLALADVGLEEWLGHDDKLEILAEVARELLELLDERVDAQALLRGRTFARALQ